MRKELFTIEYLLNNASLHVLWSMTGTALGLSEWFASGVTVEDDVYTFNWDDSEQTAILKQKKTNSFIRFQWEEDQDTEYYFELKITTVPVTGDLTLTVTDFAEHDEKDDAIMLWDKQIEELRRRTGI
jgi:hypothetical protein